MTAGTARAPPTAPGPRILVFTTNAVSDPGVDLAGSAHLDYPTGVRVIAVPCSSGISPHWVLHALEAGFDGVFIAADGGDCSKIPDCTTRTGKIASRSQEMARAAGFEPARIKMAAICSVCSEPFVAHMRKFAEALGKLPAKGAQASPTAAVPVTA